MSGPADFGVRVVRVRFSEEYGILIWNRNLHHLEVNLMKQSIQPIHVEHGPKAGGAYSTVLRAGDFVFVAGQGPLDCETHAILGDTIEDQTRNTLENVGALLRAAGADFCDCVKSTVHLLDIEEFDRFNAVYKEYFSEPRPVRTTVQSGLWHGIKVEIDVIAYKPTWGHSPLCEPGPTQRGLRAREGLSPT